MYVCNEFGATELVQVWFSLQLRVSWVTVFVKKYSTGGLSRSCACVARMKMVVGVSPFGACAQVMIAGTGGALSGLPSVMRIG